MTRNTFILNERLSYDSLEDAGRDMCLYPEAFKDAFDDASFRRWLREIDEKRGEEAIRVYDNEDDPDRGLFFASFVLNPGHCLVFGGRSFEPWESIWKIILLSAPSFDKSLVALLTGGYLTWYMRFKSLDKTRPNLYKEISKIEFRSQERPLEGWFDLGYLLSGKDTFFFEGTEYADLKDFFVKNGGNERIMTSYDFITMPYVRSYSKVVHVEKKIALADSLTKGTHDKYTALMELKDK